MPKRGSVRVPLQVFHSPNMLESMKQKLLTSTLVLFASPLFGAPLCAQGQVVRPARSQASASTPSPPNIQRWREEVFDKTAFHAEFAGDDLWVGTEMGGVYRWNTLTGESENFTRVNHGLGSNTVVDLVVNGEEVWAGHWDSLSYFDGQTWTSFDSSNSPLRSALALAIDFNGDTWIGTYDQGLFRFDGTTWTNFNAFNSGLSDNFVTSLEFDASGALWMGVWGKGVDRYIPGNWSHFQPSNTGSDGLLSSFVWVREAHPTDGRVWFYCHDDDFQPDVGVVTYDGAGGWSRSLPAGANSIHTEYIHSILVDRQNDVWFKGDGSISRFDGTNWKLFEGISGGFDLNLPHGNAMAAKPNGDLWTATAMGIAKFNGSTFDSHATAGLWDMDVAEVAVDAQGRGWLATREGLHVLDQGQWTRFTTQNSPLPANEVVAVATLPNGGVLLGTHQGAVLYQGGQWTVWNTSNSGIHSNHILAVAASQSGALWFASNFYGSGASRYENGQWTHFSAQAGGLSTNSINGIMGDPNTNDVWFTSSQGANRYGSGLWSYFPIGAAAGDSLKDVAFAPNGDLWFARTQGISLIRAGTQFDFSTAHGLAENNTNALAIDDLGHVWAGHQDYGVSRFNGTTWKTFDDEDGLTNVRVKSIATGPGGVTWFGTGVNLGLFKRTGW